MRIGENILIICTYEGLGKTYSGVLEQYGLEIDLEIMDNRYGKEMPKVLEYVDGFRKKGKEIVITRGFLAAQIRKHLSYKVIEINIDGIDVLQTLQPYLGKVKRVGIVECAAFLRVVAPISRLLGFETTCYEVGELEDFDRGLDLASSDGADLIIGGAWNRYDEEGLKRFPIPYAAIESSEESIKNSLDNALEIYGMTYEEQKRKELMETIMDFSDGGIFAVDEEMRILAVNTYVRNLCKTPVKALMGKALADTPLYLPIEEVVAKQSGQFSRYITLCGEGVLMNAVPLFLGEDAVGAVVTLKKGADVQEEEKLIRSELVKKGLSAKYTLEHIHGESKQISELKHLVTTYAKTDATVLILGETGTGKELFAQAIHGESSRRREPFVALNCSSLPSALLESELFGYVEGAFTGARRGGKAGVFELAHKGTIFLDEIGDMDLSMQSRLLRVVQEKEIMRIGDDKVISIDVRIVAATHRDLRQAVEEGLFREDLYYRLHILDIHIPPLRERKGDIPVLAEAMLPAINRSLNCRVTGFEESVLTRLKCYDWRGNIRQLRNVLEKMTIVVQYGVIHQSQVDFVFHDLDRQRQKTEAVGATSPMNLKEREIEIIRDALAQTGGNKTKAAAILGIDRTTLLRKLSRIEL